jgi:delta 1-pyrroline-5-carboxylate dehydrogenase
MMLMELLNEAGCPPGVVNVIHGAHEAVNFICDHSDIKAISFVGSDAAVSKCEICYVHPATELQILHDLETGSYTYSYDTVR